MNGGQIAAMEINQHLKKSNDPVIERAACDFERRAAHAGRPTTRGISLRIGNLVMVFRVPLAVAYYEVFKRGSGQEDISLLVDPSEADFVRLSDA